MEIFVLSRMAEDKDIEILTAIKGLKESIEASTSDFIEKLKKINSLINTQNQEYKKNPEAALNRKSALVISGYYAIEKKQQQKANVNMNKTRLDNMIMYFNNSVKRNPTLTKEDALKQINTGKGSISKEKLEEILKIDSAQPETTSSNAAASGAAPGASATAPKARASKKPKKPALLQAVQDVKNMEEALKRETGEMGEKELNIIKSQIVAGELHDLSIRATVTPNDDVLNEVLNKVLKKAEEGKNLGLSSAQQVIDRVNEALSSKEEQKEKLLETLPSLAVTVINQAKGAIELKSVSQQIKNTLRNKSLIAKEEIEEKTAQNNAKQQEKLNQREEEFQRKKLAEASGAEVF